VRVWVRGLGALIAVTAALVGCGDDDASPDPPDRPITELLAYLEGDVPFAYATDVDLARQELHLPEDADATDLWAASELDPGDPLIDLIQAVGPGLPALDEFVATFEVPAVLEAIDGTRLSAIANNKMGAAEEVAVLATAQPFDEIAEELEGTYTRDGETLRSTDPEMSVARLDDLGDGLILLTGRKVDADALIDNPPGGPTGAEAMIGDSTGPTFSFINFSRAPGCVLGAAIIGPADQTAGQIAVLVEGDASVKAVPTGTVDGDDWTIELGEASAVGSVVTVPYSAALEANRTATPAPLGLLVGGDVYDCSA
jgi:hypothetical protein